MQYCCLAFSLSLFGRDDESLMHGIQRLFVVARAHDRRDNADGGQTVGYEQNTYFKYCI